MQKLLFIYNPHSGKGLIKSNVADIIDIFTKNGFTVTVRPTQKPLDAYEYIRNFGYKYNRIVISGGDGTLTEAVRGLMAFDKSKRPHLGYIPSGTTNDFASTLSIPKNMIEAAHIAAEGHEFQCDVGMFNETTFNYVAAFGAFTDVSYDTPQDAKNLFGHAAYIMEGIKRLPLIQSNHVKIKYDGGELEDNISLCLILNSTSVGGMFNTERITNVDLNDGLFEMIIFRQPTNAMQLQFALAQILMTNTSGSGYEIYHSSRFEFSSDESIKWTLDGESGGETNKAVIEVIPSAITYIL